jgi:hypothetical protein
LLQKRLPKQHQLKKHLLQADPSQICDVIIYKGQV